MLYAAPFCLSDGPGMVVDFVSVMGNRTWGGIQGRKGMLLARVEELGKGICAIVLVDVFKEGRAFHVVGLLRARGWE